MQKRSIQNQRRANNLQQNVASSICNFTNCLLLIVFTWLCFLYYCHEIDHKTIAEELAKDLAMLKRLESEAEMSIIQLSQSALSIGARSQDELIDRHEEMMMQQQQQEQQQEQQAQQQQQPHQQQQQQPSIHVVFSTDCSFFQDWQTLLIFHSAQQVRQPGTVTRIASGCDSEKQQQLLQLYKKLHPQYENAVHFTPDFKTDSKTKKKYDFYNKPYGVHHWLQHAVPAVKAGTVVVIIDPDMIFLRPITGRIRGNDNNIFYSHRAVSRDAATTATAAAVIPQQVQRGTAVAQLYGLGAPWATDSAREMRNFNRSAICGKHSPCMKVSRRYGEQHFSVGPPYMLERDDLLRLTTVWTEMVPRVYEKYPNLLAEMYAYSMAAAHTELPHLTLLNLMVSNTHVDEEGWAFIDALGDDVCEPPVATTAATTTAAAEGVVYYPGRPMPNVLHFCQFFRAGEIGFQKRRIRSQIFDCDKPMMQQLPRDLGTVTYKNRDGEILKLSKKEARRNAFMLCVIHRSINDMLSDYKQKMCSPAEFINSNKTINVVSKDYWGS